MRQQDAHYPMLGKLVHCNVLFKGPGLQRLLTLVDNAMQRWAARHGRYDVLAAQPQHTAAAKAAKHAAQPASRTARQYAAQDDELIEDLGGEG
jgi:hypothetical protein